MRTILIRLIKNEMVILSVMRQVVVAAKINPAESVKSE